MYLLLAQNPALDCHGCFELWLRRDILSSRYGAIFFSPFLKLLDCCWIVFLLPQGTNWAIQRSATKQTDADEMRGSTFHWYLVSNNPDDVFANVTDEQQRRWGWSWCALPSAKWSSFQISCHSTTSSLVNLVNGGLCTFILLGNHQWTIPPPPFLSAN